jgi:hypothetical protein
MKQSSIEWLITELSRQTRLYTKQEIIDQAKEMHKKEVIDAYNENENYMCDGTEAEQYYNETFKTESNEK